jgi:hypothetical protein
MAILGTHYLGSRFASNQCLPRLDCQLMPAIVEFVGDGPTTQDRVVFKIDTVTGETWTYLYTKSKGKIVEGWAPIDQ